MSDTLVFSSARLLSFSRKGGAGEARFSASITAAVMKTLKWEEIPECLTSAKPEGELHGTECILAPDEDGLKRQKITLAISRVSGFEVVRLELEGKKSKGHRLELRFGVQFTDPAGAAKLEKYMLVAGEAKAKLTVSYVRQQEMDLAGEERRQATLAEND